MKIRIARTPMIRAKKERQDAARIFEAGLQAIDTKAAVANTVLRVGDTLKVGVMSYNLKDYDHVYVIAIGKAAYDASVALERVLGSRLTDGIALDVKSGPLKRMKSIAGTHPLPSVGNMRATGEIMGLMKQVDHTDLVIAVISGGGSALLCWPHQLKCGQLAELTDALMRAGATIQELNTVRKHLSEVQGGQLARLAHPATVLGLVFSDVPGDDLGMIASGPTVLDQTTVEDAQRIVKHYGLEKQCGLDGCEWRETPKDPLYFSSVTNHLVVSNRVALEAMQKEAKRLGYRVRVYSHTLTGEAREVGVLLAALPKTGECVLATGETTVTVKGTGVGGRNQELALGALSVVQDGVLVASCASDGVDHSLAAGAFVDAEVYKKASRLNIDVEKALSTNSSFALCKRLGIQYKTGMTGANVSDLMLAIRK